MGRIVCYDAAVFRIAHPACKFTMMRRVYGICPCRKYGYGRKIVFDGMSVGADIDAVGESADYAWALYRTG